MPISSVGSMVKLAPLARCGTLTISHSKRGLAPPPDVAVSVTVPRASRVPPTWVTLTKVCVPTLAPMTGASPPATKRKVISGWRKSCSSVPTRTVSMGVTFSDWPWRTLPLEASPVCAAPPAQRHSASQATKPSAGTLGSGGAVVTKPACTVTCSSSAAVICTMREAPLPEMASAWSPLPMTCSKLNAEGLSAVRPNCTSTSPCRPNGEPISKFFTPPERSPMPGRLRGA